MGILKKLRGISEWLLFPVAFYALYQLVPDFLYWLDPTAAILDAGSTLMPLLIGATGTIMAIGMYWLWVWFRSPTRYKFHDKEFAETFKELTAWQKHLVIFLYFFAFLLTFSLLTLSVA